MSNIEHLGDPVQHFWLTRSVARSLGVSLSEAMAEGTLSARGYADMVTRCRRCAHVDACLEWLGDSNKSGTQAPESCVNAELLNGLRIHAGRGGPKGKAI